MKRSIGWNVLAAVVVAALSAAAYDYPLSSEAVREAYFLGQRRDMSTAKILAQYVKRLPATNAPWQVAEMEVRTPFYQVALRSWRSLPGYSGQQAWEEYRKRKPQIIVRVYLATALTQLIAREDAWRVFKFRVKQEKEIPPTAVTGWPVYFYAHEGSRIGGAEVYLELDAAQVSSGTLRVEVTSPEGQVSSAEFDLSKLR
jgi:hypothetical protein